MMSYGVFVDVRREGYLTSMVFKVYRRYLMPECIVEEEHSRKNNFLREIATGKWKIRILVLEKNE